MTAWEEGRQCYLSHSGIAFACFGKGCMRVPVEDPKTGPAVICCAATEKALDES